MEILDAQKERISRIEIPAGVESSLMNDKDQDALGIKINISFQSQRK